MSRPLRIQYPGALYHITSRGNAKHKIFLNKEDYENFLIILSDIVKRYNWICYTYCLMPNHYHLLIETPDANLAAGMRQLNGVYTQKFNFIHKRVGHLFQGRYKAILVEKESYLGELMRYIALNPVRANIVKTLSQWLWSGHKEIIGQAKRGVVNGNYALSVFGNNSKEAKKEYLKFLKERNEDADMWEDLKGGVIFGSFEFIEKIKEYFKNKESFEIPRRERFSGRPLLKDIFKEKELLVNKKERNRLIIEAYEKHGYSLSEIGRCLNLHYSAISKVIKSNKLQKS